MNLLLLYLLHTEYIHTLIQVQRILKNHNTSREWLLNFVDLATSAKRIELWYANTQIARQQSHDTLFHHTVLFKPLVTHQCAVVLVIYFAIHLDPRPKHR